MIKVLTVRGASGEEKILPLMSNGNTVRRYKQVFGRDFYADSECLADEKSSLAERLETVTRLAFIMNCQATGRDMSKMRGPQEAALEAWLDELDSSTIAENYAEIYSVYLDTSRILAKPKNA